MRCIYKNRTLLHFETKLRACLPCFREPLFPSYLSCMAIMYLFVTANKIIKFRFVSSLEEIGAFVPRASFFRS